MSDVCVAAKLGIMQGRLVPPEPGHFQSFPRHRWRDEFALASAAGLDAIEWIYDAYGEDVNPLTTDAGIREIRALVAGSQVGVESVCADWFMDFPLIRVEPEAAVHGWQRLRWLMEQCAKLHINRIVLPFVDASSIESPVDREDVVAGMRDLGGLIDQLKVEIHLETSLAPALFAALLSEIGHQGVKVNYDSGNSASLGFKSADEFAHYGAQVGSVHIKDRLLNGGTVPLGEGDADFRAVFSALARSDYRGDFILQVARSSEGDELEWARSNAAKARAMMAELRDVQQENE